MLFSIDTRLNNLLIKNIFSNKGIFYDIKIHSRATSTVRRNTRLCSIIQRFRLVFIRFTTLTVMFYNDESVLRIRSNIHKNILRIRIFSSQSRTWWIPSIMIRNTYVIRSVLCLQSPHYRATNRRRSYRKLVIS